MALPEDETVDAPALDSAGPEARRGLAAPPAGGLPPGARVGRYIVEGPLGGGGMGLVYVARDPELGRRIAIKVLHAGAGGSDTSGPSVRLLREAQALAKLQHPNVVAVHDVGRTENGVFIAMELVAGPTLRAWLARPRRRREVLEAFAQAGRGLVAAHRLGIVHRDFKPENVLVGDDGRVRVADFGLARPGDAPEPALAPTPSPAVGALTRTGAVMGTPAYMSPEQHLGLPTDARSDQFSFAAALFEALAGQRPFEGDSLAALAASVTRGQARALPKRCAPAHVRRAILHALAADPAARFASMEALLSALAPRRRGALLVALGGSALVLAAVLGLLFRRAPAAPAPLLHRQLTFDGDVSEVALSPDARRLAYRRGGRVHVMSPDGATRTLLDAGAADLHGLRWTDNATVATCLSDQLRRIRVDTAVASPGPRCGRLWDADARYLLSGNNGARTVRLDGPDGERVLPLGDDFDFVLDVGWSDGARRIAVAVRRGSRFRVLLLRPDGSDRREVLAADAPLGWMRFSPRGDALTVLRIESRMSVPLRLALRDGVPVDEPAAISLGAVETGSVEISDDGRRVAYVSSQRRARLQLREPSGTTVDLTRGTSYVSGPLLSPDGERLAFQELAGDRARIMLADLKTRAARELLSLPAASQRLALAWSPDGARLALVRPVGARPRVSTLDVTSGRLVDLPCEVPSDYAVQWTKGLGILVAVDGNRNFLSCDPETARGARLVRNPEVGWIFAPRESPDGSQVAVFWNRPDGRGLWLISPGDGAQRHLGASGMPLGWSADGRAIEVAAGEMGERRSILAVPVAGGEPRQITELGENVEDLDLRAGRLVYTEVDGHSDVWLAERSP